VFGKINRVMIISKFLYSYRLLVSRNCCNRDEDHCSTDVTPPLVSQTGKVHLTVVPIDGETFKPRLLLDVDPSTLIEAIPGLIRNRLRNVLIGEYYRSNLDVLPLKMMPTLDQLKGEDLAKLRNQVRQHDALQDDVAEFFGSQISDGIHCLVWLPPKDRE